MEIGIPLLALGGMYIIANKDNQNKRQINAKQKSNENVHMEPFSNLNNVESKALVSNNNTNNTNNNNIINNLNNRNSIEPNTQQFEHNNMIPFNGGKVRGAVFDYNGNESILDNKVGFGSNTIKKVEQAPFFKPEDNVNLTYGSQNKSDFYQSRMMTGTQKTNLKPFESEMVGPGLGKDYNSQATGGFNSGMESRDSWKPYTVDEMRVKTNPKIEYNLSGLQGPAFSHIKTASTKESLGRFEKNRPDRHFEMGQDRWMTTTGSEKESTYRSEQQLGNVKRTDTETNYKGHAISDKKGPYAKKNYEESRRTLLPTHDNPAPNAVNKGPNYKNDMPIKSYTNYVNNRASTTHNLPLGGISGALGAVVAPIIDLFKPTLKEEVVENMRVFGDAKQSVSSNYVYDHNNKPKTTNKETTIYSSQFNINKQGEASYINNYKAPAVTQRNDSCSDYIGGASSKIGTMNYDNVYRQTSNEIKSSTINNRIHQGGTQLFNSDVNMTLANKASNIEQNRMNAPHMANFQTPSIQTHGVSKYSRESEDTSQSRLDGELLQGFRKNPYTHSLSSHA